VRRKPAVAGAFYPASVHELKELIKELLSKSPRIQVEGEVKGLISPHAGYVYSGIVAACGYNLLNGKKIKRVILLGPSHTAYFRGIALYPEGEWETPLGVVPIDEETARKILKVGGPFFEAPHLHEAEHSLEVQIPFLQSVLGNFTVVPLLFGFGDTEDFLDAATILSELAREKNTLLLASSDLYHGYSYEEAVETDNYTLELIKEGDPVKFARALSSERAQACGGWPIVTLMETMRRIGAVPKLLYYANSGDVTGIKTGYVVGYGSLAFVAPHENKEKLSEDEKATLLRIAKSSVEAAVRGAPQKTETPPYERLHEKRGAFVTLKKQGQLRGCIGYVLPVKPLYQAVSDVAVSAALRDPRFPPVTPEELNELEYEISVLTVPRKIKNIEEIIPGRHGLIIKRGYFEGLLLPQVATEYGWDRETFLKHTCLKAGLEPDCYLHPDTEIYVFEAEVFNEADILKSA